MAEINLHDSSAWALHGADRVPGRQVYFAHSTHVSVAKLGIYCLQLRHLGANDRSISAEVKRVNEINNLCVVETQMGYEEKDRTKATNKLTTGLYIITTHAI